MTTQSSFAEEWDNFEFIALDFETANDSRDSMSQIGLCVCRRDGEISHRLELLVNQGDEFKPARYRSLTKESVQGAPTFPDVYASVVSRLHGTRVVCHGGNSFDSSVLEQTCHRHGLKVPQINWHDSLYITSRHLQHLELENKKLETIYTAVTGRELLNHHSALPDAEAVATIVFAAAKRTGDWSRIWSASGH